MADRKEIGRSSSSKDNNKKEEDKKKVTKEDKKKVTKEEKKKITKEEILKKISLDKDSIWIIDSLENIPGAYEGLLKDCEASPKLPFAQAPGFDCDITGLVTSLKPSTLYPFKLEETEKKDSEEDLQLKPETAGSSLQRGCTQNLPDAAEGNKPKKEGNEKNPHIQPGTAGDSAPQGCIEDLPDVGEGNESTKEKEKAAEPESKADSGDVWLVVKVNSKDGTGEDLNKTKNVEEELYVEEESLHMECTDDTPGVALSIEEALERIRISEKFSKDSKLSPKGSTQNVGEASKKSTKEVEATENSEGLDPLDPLDPRNMDEERKKQLVKDLAEAMSEIKVPNEKEHAAKEARDKSKNHTEAIKYTMLRGETTEWQNKAIVPTYTSITQQVVASCLQRGDRIFLEDVVNYKSITYKDFLKQGLIIKERLDGIVGTAQVVLMVSDGSLDAWVVEFGVGLSGNRAAYVNPSSSPDELNQHMYDLQPTMIYTDNQHHAKVDEVSGSTLVLVAKNSPIAGRKIFFVDEWLNMYSRPPVPMPSSLPDGQSDVVRLLVNFPIPKPPYDLPRNHGLWYRAHDKAINHYVTVSQHSWDEKSKILMGCSMSFEHNSFLMYQAAVSGCHVILTPGMGGQGQLQIAQKYMPTEWYSSPHSLIEASTYMAQKCLREQVKGASVLKVRYPWMKIYCLGYNLSPEGKDTLRETLLGTDASDTSICVAYGTTDSGLVSFHNLPNSNSSLTSTPGVLLSGVQIKIIDLFNRTLPERKIGEICVNSPGVLKAHRKLIQFMTSDGFLRTGDWGFIQDGHLHVCRKQTDSVISNNKQASARLLQRRLGKSPWIKSSVVMALQCPETRENKCVAFVETSIMRAIGKDCVPRDVASKFDQVIFASDLQKMIEKRVEWTKFSKNTA